MDFYNNRTTDEFVDDMLLNVPIAQKIIDAELQKNHHIEWVFSNLRLSVFNDTLLFIKNHNTMTEDDMNAFIQKTILDIK